MEEFVLLGEKMLNQERLQHQTHDRAHIGDMLTFACPYAWVALGLEDINTMPKN